MEMNILEAVRMVNGYSLETVAEAREYERVTVTFFGGERSLAELLEDNERVKKQLLAKKDVDAEVVAECVNSMDEVNNRIRKALKTLGS